MKLSLNWLKEYIDPKLSTEALVERLTMAGLEVEAVESIAGSQVLEIEVTPNRPDCLNVLGLARETGAITGRSVKYPKVKNVKTAGLKNLVHVEDKKDCSRYIVTLIRNVRIAEAPLAMKNHLAAVGIHAINNAVDITNFVLMETGQPLHAFDYDKLAGGTIAVRRAKAGETMVTLDGVERKLDPSILVVADAQKPVAIAGIMGGMDTQITAQTKNILLESAHFDMGLVRRACRNLGLRSDSSYRFERNVSWDGVLTGADRATGLLISLTGGQLAGRAEVAAKSSAKTVKIKVKISDIEDLLGMAVNVAKAKTALAKLGFKVTGKAAQLTVLPPASRMDVRQDVDVIEEIARMTGFDRLPSKLPRIMSANIDVDQRPRQVKKEIRRVLTAGGIDEIITLSMISAKALAKINMAETPAVRIFNPLSQDQELMRPLLLPSFLQVAATNFNRGQKDLRFFEIGKIYSKDGEKESVAILLNGRRGQDWRSSKKDLVDVFDLKGDVESIFKVIGISPQYKDVSIPVFDPSCSVSVVVDGKAIGVLGKISRNVLNNWDIKNQDIYFAAVYLDGMAVLPQAPLKYRPIAEFPAIVRDVSLAVKKEVPYKKIADICRAAGGDMLASVDFIEQYLGDKIPAGQKGLVFSCRYQSNDRTLREEEVNAVHERIVQALVHDLGAVRR